MKNAQYIFGIRSTQLLQEESELLRNADLFGVVLFRRNISSQEQVKKLIKDIKNTLGSHVKICIDQEGGRVQRINFNTIYPNARQLSQRGDDFLISNVTQMSKELKDLGFDINFAPVCDILHPVKTTLLNDRVFDNDPLKVAHFADKFITTSLSEGIECVLKHIPGHGRAEVDSHLELPVIKTSLSTLIETDFKPFKLLSEKCKYAMTAHVIYDSLDPNRPITTSADAIKYIKENLFPHTIITDAIEMGAMLKHYDKKLKSPCEDVNHYDSSEYRTTQDICNTLGRITRDSISAGCDIIMHCSGNIEEISAILGHGRIQDN